MIEIKILKLIEAVTVYKCPVWIFAIVNKCRLCFVIIKITLLALIQVHKR